MVKYLLIVLALAVGAILLRDCIKKLKTGAKNEALQYVGIGFGVLFLAAAAYLIITLFL